MSGVLPVYGKGPLTYPVKTSVLGGQLVQARTDSTVETAAAGSLKILGVALQDGYATDGSAGTTSYGEPIYDVNFPEGGLIAVASSGIFKLAFTGAVAFGECVKAGATGSVVKWVSGTDAADLIVGRCVELAGVSSGASGLVQLSVV